MANASFVLLPDRGVLAVSGPDRRPFLQGLVSNDVDKIGPTAAQYAALLTAQGKYLYDFIIIEVGESLWVDAEVLRLSELKKRLSLYRLRAKVELDEKAELGVAVVLGKGAAAAFDLPDSPGAARTFGGGVVFVDPRLVSLRVRALLPRETARTILIDAGLVEENAEVYDRLRLSLDIPDGSRDLVLEKSILLESGFDAERFGELVQDAEVKARLLDNTARSVERGTFGSPTFFVGDEIFFGKDRLRDVEEMILVAHQSETG